MIAIIDYGMGNLRSVQKGFEKVGHPAVVTGKPDEIMNADGVVLPGVGAFRDCMKNLTDGGLIGPIRKIIEKGRPFLGIGLGLQLLFTESQEFGQHKGLDIIKGKVKRFPFYGPKKNGSGPTESSGEILKVPHMGWNTISFRKKPAPFQEIEDGSYFYFVHSYYVEPEDREAVLTTTNYGIDFTSAIAKENVYAVQFHPEKSQAHGLSLLKQFGDLL